MKSTAAVFLAIVTLVSTEATSPIRVQQRITVSKPGDNYNSSLGIVNGLRSCGGRGRVVQLRIEGCSGDGICRIPGDDQRVHSELEFIPSEDIDALGVRYILITESETKQMYDRAIADSSVQGGEKYIVNAGGSARKELKGQTITIQYILYRVDNNNVDVCSELDLEIV